MTYRSAEDALRERTRLLEGELSSLREKRAASERLDDDIARAQERLDKAKILGERFAQKRALPMLDKVQIASPCGESWADMTGDDKARYCGKCEKHVYNLSAMTREEAELVMLEKEGNLCVRLYRRKDGTVITADCPVGVRRKRLRLVGVLTVGAAAMAAGVSAALLTQSRHATVVQGGMEPIPTAVLQPQPIEQVEMGDIAEPPPPKAAPKPPHVQKPQGGVR
ncbi:MAG: hypothetical protein IPK71_01785 [Myxococcales bacterium]|nr:hypothetical protein [Myxococcales bacterium]MBL9108205.1 hypothetical protein [Myxococcales bacterium]